MILNGFIQPALILLRVIALYSIFLSTREIKFLEALCELGFLRWFSPFLRDESRTLFDCFEMRNQSKKILFVISEPLLEYGIIQKSSEKNKQKQRCPLMAFTRNA